MTVAPTPLRVECCVFLHDDGSLTIHGESGVDAEQTEAGRPDQKCVAKITVVMPRSLQTGFANSGADCPAFVRKDDADDE